MLGGAAAGSHLCRARVSGLSSGFHPRPRCQSRPLAAPGRPASAGTRVTDRAVRSMATQGFGLGNVVPDLRGVGPGGWSAALKYYGFAAFFGTMQAATLALNALKSPFKFFSAKDRSHLDNEEPLPGAVHEYLSVGNGVSIHAVSYGPRTPDRPLMLFLHGFPEFWYSWRHQLKYYKEKGYDAVAIDMRGYGLSSKPPRVNDYRLDVVASDVAAVIQALGHERCVLVAHDWGGAIAWVTACLYPALIDRLVVMAAPHLGLSQLNMSPAQNRKSWYILLFQVPLIPELTFRAFDYKALGDCYRSGTNMGPTSPNAFTKTDIEWYKHAFQNRPGALTAALNYYRALCPHMTYAPIKPVWDSLRRELPMPILTIMGAKDGALEPGLMNGLDKVAPKSQSHVLPDCSHWVQCDQPDQVHKLMDAFLQQHPPTAAAKGKGSKL